MESATIIIPKHQYKLYPAFCKKPIFQTDQNMKKHQQYIDAWREVFKLNQDDSDCDI